MFLTATPPAVQSKDVHYHPYLPNFYLYYLTGCDEPNTALLLSVKEGNIDEEILFCKKFDATVVQWEGAYLTPDKCAAAVGMAGADVALLPDKLLSFLQQHEVLYYLPGDSEFWDRWLSDKLHKKRQSPRQHPLQLRQMSDVSAVLDSMRLIKDDTEIAHIKKACGITEQCLAKVLGNIHHPTSENQIAAQLGYEYALAGATHAFPPIVAGGVNACCLHYIANNKPVDPKKLLLIDTGCRVHHYASDVTRTFPADGQWQSATRDLYEVVLVAQQNAINNAQCCTEWSAVNQQVVADLSDGLRQLKICQASLEEIIDKKLYKKFYMHGVGHPLGLDVHDVGALTVLQSNMVVTVEPGLYIPDDDAIPPAFRGTGIRIEDDVLIGESSNTVLTESIPKQADAIANWVKQ